MDPNVLSTLVDLGGQGILVFFIAQLWSEIRETNKYLREQNAKQQQADDERRELEEKVASLSRYRAQMEAERRGGARRDI